MSKTCGYKHLLLRSIFITMILSSVSLADWQQVYVNDNCATVSDCDKTVSTWFAGQKTEDWESFLIGLLGEIDIALNAVNRAQTVAVVGSMDTVNLGTDLRILASALLVDSAITLGDFLGEREKKIQLAITMTGDSSDIADLWNLVQLRNQKLLTAQTAAQSTTPSLDLGCSSVQPPLFIDSSLFLSRGSKLVLVSSLPKTGAAESGNAVGLAHFAGFGANIDLAKVWQNYDWWNLPGVTTGDSSSCLDLWSIGHSQGTNAVLGINSVNSVGTMLKSVHVLQGKAVFLGSDITMSGKAWTTVAQLPMSELESPAVSTNNTGLVVQTSKIRFVSLENEHYDWADSLRGGSKGIHFLTIRKEHGISPRGAGYAFEWEYGTLDTTPIVVLKRNSAAHAVLDLRDSSASVIYWRADTVNDVLASGPMAVQFLPQSGGTLVRLTVGMEYTGGSLSFLKGIDSLQANDFASLDATDSNKVNIQARPGSTVQFWLKKRNAVVPGIVRSDDAAAFVTSNITINHDPLYRNFTFSINSQLKEHAKVRLDVMIVNSTGEVVHAFYPIFSDWRGNVHHTLDWQQSHINSARLYLVIGVEGKSFTKEFGVLH